MSLLLPTRFLTADVQKLMLRRATQPWEGKQLLPEVDGSHPAVVSDSSAFLNFQREVRHRLMNDMPVSKAEDGLYDRRGVAVSWENASYVAGYAMTPVTVPPVNNEGMVPGLATRFLKPMHQKIYDLFFDWCFNPARYKPASAHFNKLAHTGAPFRRTSHPEFKLAILSRTTGVSVPQLNANPDSPTAWHDMCQLLLQNKYDEAADRFGASCLSILGFRRQSSDKGTLNSDETIFTPKERLVNDVQYALSGGKKGRRFAADRRIVIDGKVVRDMAAQRCRTVWGGPGWNNYPFTVLLAQARASYFERGSWTWEHRGSSDIERKLRDMVAVENLDVSQYDQSFQPWLIEHFCDCWAKYLPETTAFAMRLAFHLPYFVPNPDVNESGGFVIGNPSRPEGLRYGLPSGIAVNPDVGKFHVPWAIMCMLDDLFGDMHTEESITQFMQGSYPRFSILNCGDDTVMIFRDQEAKDEIDDWFASHRPGALPWYFVMQPEAAGTFLGNVLVRDGASIRVMPNIFSAYANWWMAERGVDHPSRRDYWHIGWQQRNALFAQCPEYETYERVISDCSRKHFGHPADEWAIIKGGSLQYDGINALVAAKPDLLQWRFRPDDPELDQNLVAQTMTTVDVDTCQRITEVLLRG